MAFDTGPDKNSLIYFDNAATSFPKPNAVMESVIECMAGSGGNPGRAGHRLSIAAGTIIFESRQAVANLFGIANPMRCIFCANATEALNLAILGLYKPGDHVITTSMEHNSVIRPLKHLESTGKITLTIARCAPEDGLTAEKLMRLITAKTSIVVVNHASNVTGTVQPLREIGALCRKKNICFLVDGSQSCGVIPVDMQSDNIDLLAFSGHKGLYGPMGSGGLVLAGDFDATRLRPLKFGGTGSASDRIEQPVFLPDCFESGTPNVASLCGLLAGITHITALPGGITGIHRYKKKLSDYFLDRAQQELKGFKNFTPRALLETGVIAFNLAGLEPSHVAQQLDERWGILCRAGLHCSPLAHESLGTFPRGTLRFSFGIFNTENEIGTAIEALKTIGSEAGHA